MPQNLLEYAYPICRNCLKYCGPTGKKRNGYTTIYCAVNGNDIMKRIACTEKTRNKYPCTHYLSKSEAIAKSNGKSIEEPSTRLRNKSPQKCGTVRVNTAE